MVVTSNALVAVVTMKGIVIAMTRVFEVVAWWMLTWHFAVEVACGTSVAMFEEDSFVV